MINHVRTLLINEAQNHGEVFFPPEFGGVRVPSNLKRLSTVIIGSAQQANQRFSTVDRWLALLHNADYLPLTLGMDSRITYSNSEYTVDKNSLPAGTLRRVVSEANLVVGDSKGSLFYPVPTYVSQISTLKNMWVASAPLYHTAAIAVLAYAYQLEGVRLDG